MNTRDATFPLFKDAVVASSTMEGPRDQSAALAGNPGMPKFLMSNVADMCASDGRWGAPQKDLMKIRLRPPFDIVWCEAAVPVCIWPDRDRAEAYQARIGALIRYHKHGYQMRLPAGNSESVVSLWIWRQVHLHEIGPMMCLYVGLDADGFPKGDKDGRPYYALSPEDDAQGTFESVAADASVFLYGLGLLNCKNIDAVDVAFRPSVAQRRAWKIPSGEIKYKVIVVNAPGTTRSRRKKTEGEHTERSWHICRGHFKNYTAERPLFGRFVGSFWTPSHTRGSREVGVLLKDYEEHVVT